MNKVNFYTGVSLVAAGILIMAFNLMGYSSKPTGAVFLVLGSVSVFASGKPPKEISISINFVDKEKESKKKKN